MAVNRSASVAPEVNLRNSLQAGNEAHKQGSNMALKPRVDINKNSKTGVSVAPKRTDVLQFLKKERVSIQFICQSLSGHLLVAIFRKLASLTEAVTLITLCGQSTKEPRYWNWTSIANKLCSQRSTVALYNIFSKARKAILKSGWYCGSLCC